MSDTSSIASTESTSSLEPTESDREFINDCPDCVGEWSTDDEDGPTVTGTRKRRKVTRWVHPDEAEVLSEAVKEGVLEPLSEGDSGRRTCFRGYRVLSLQLW